MGPTRGVDGTADHGELAAGKSAGTSRVRAALSLCGHGAAAALPGGDDRLALRRNQRGPAGARPAGGDAAAAPGAPGRSEEHTSELQSQSNLVCRLLL